jgi:hypothetical protein
MVTVNRLGLPAPLRRSLACTNGIENMMGTVRRVCHNVKRWRNAKTALRCTAAGMMEATKGFRRLRAYRQLPILNLMATDYLSESFEYCVADVAGRSGPVLAIISTTIFSLRLDHRKRRTLPVRTKSIFPCRVLRHEAVHLVSSASQRKSRERLRCQAIARTYFPKRAAGFAF